jgi:hypothetical protein
MGRCRLHNLLAGRTVLVIGGSSGIFLMTATFVTGQVLAVDGGVSLTC